jgi:pentatricopeptide repeat domain-containing protein 1
VHVSLPQPNCAFSGGELTHHELRFWWHREKNLEKALDLLRDMKAQNIQPEVYTFTSLINVCEKKKDLSTYGSPHHPLIACPLLLRAWPTRDARVTRLAGTAMTLFGEMTRVHKILPNTITFNSLLNVCVEKRDLDKCMEVLGMMRQFHVPPNGVSFNALVSLCAKTGNVAKGMEILGMMKSAGVPADNLTFTLLITACRTWDGDDGNGSEVRNISETNEIFRYSLQEIVTH